MRKDCEKISRVPREEHLESLQHTLLSPFCVLLVLIEHFAVMGCGSSKQGDLVQTVPHPATPKADASRRNSEEGSSATEELAASAAPTRVVSVDKVASADVDLETAAAPCGAVGALVCAAASGAAGFTTGSVMSGDGGGLAELGKATGQARVPCR